MILGTALTRSEISEYVELIESYDIPTYLSVSLLALIIWLIQKHKEDRKKLQELASENRILIADNALLEAEHLKFQLQPHTLRNMVATLHVAAKNLYKGSTALAETLDYILYHGNKHLVSVEEELTFLQNYKSLQGSFINQIDSIRMDVIDVDKASRYYKSPCIPHLITAYFIENAFKHGDVKHPEFLNVQVKLVQNTFELIVVNRIAHYKHSTKVGLGLTNMRKRLDLLHSGRYEIKHSCNEIEYHSVLRINL